MPFYGKSEVPLRVGPNPQIDDSLNSKLAALLLRKDY